MTRTKSVVSLLACPLTAVVLLLATNATAHAAITADTTTITLHGTTGGSIPTRTIQLRSTTPGEAYEIFTDPPWVRMEASDMSGVAPRTITVGADPSVGVGFHVGHLQIISVADNQSTIVTVNFTVGAGDGGGGDGGGGGGENTVTPSENSLLFQYTIGDAAPASKDISLSGTVAFLADRGASPWLSVTPTSGTAPATLSVSVNPAGLSAGTYQGSIAINAGTTSTPVQVTLIVVTGGGPALTASLSSMTFSQTIGEIAPPLQFLTVNQSNGPTPFTASASASWLTVSPLTSTTPSTLSISVSAAGLTAGAHLATITLNSGASAITVPVTFNVSPGAGGASFSVTPSSLSFSQKLGESAPATQMLTVKTPTAGIPFTAVWNGGWLRALPPTGLTPADVEVGVNASLLTAGTYEGSVVVTINGTSVSVPVTFTVTEAPVIANPATVQPTSLAFAYNLNGPPPAPKTLHLDNPDATKPFTAIATSTGKWLSVTPSAGLTPADLSVIVNPTGLPVGAYQGSIAINTGSTPLSVSVSLVITKLTLTSAAQPSFLGFTGAVGAAAPPPQTIIVTSSGTPFTFSATPTTANQVNWLTVTPAGTTPAPLTVSVSPTGLPAGQYTGTIDIKPTDTSIGASSVNVTFTVAPGAPAAPTPIVRSVVNAGSMQPGSVAPGEIVVIRGSYLGPDLGVGPEILPAGAVTSSLRGTRVLFDGIAAPLMYAQSNQITTIVPYGMYGRFSTTMQVEVSGSKSEPLQLMIENTSPSVFTADGSGSGQATVTNADGGTNSNLRPALRNSLITIWGTGEGQTNPAGQDGRIIATDLRAPLAPVSVKVGGVPVEVRYVGSAPGVVSGTLQINVYLSADVPVGPNVPLEVTIGGARSQAAATIAVK